MNNSEYARLILPKVEEICLKEVKLGTVKVALNRLQEKRKNDKDLFLNKIEILESYIQNGLQEWIIEKNYDTLQSLKMLTEIALNDPSGISVGQGIYEFTIFANEKYQEFIDREIDDRFVKKTVRDLSSLTIKVPNNYIDTPNVFFSIFQRLALNDYNIFSIHSTLTEISLLVKEGEAVDVLEVIKSEL